MTVAPNESVLTETIVSASANADGPHRGSRTSMRVLEFKRGGKAPVSLQFETWGNLNAQRNNAVLILPGLSPDTHAARSVNDLRPGWWDQMIGPGKPVDTDSYFVICVNHLGSCFGSTGPASQRDDNTLWGLDFPELSIEDIARGATLVLDELHIDCVCTVIGLSMGGFVALAFNLLFPERYKKTVLVSSGVRPQAHTIAVHALQREAICNDADWANGEYGELEGGLRGMRLARKIGMSTYRSPEELEMRFGNRSGRNQNGFVQLFEVEAYLEAVANRFVERFDPNSYLFLSRAMDWFDGAHLAEECESKVLEGKKIHIIGVDSDRLFPLTQQQELAKFVEEQGAIATMHNISSPFGHDAFLVDIEQFGPLIRNALCQMAFTSSPARLANA